MEGGILQENTAFAGGGICLENGAKLTINGGIIRRNSAGSGGGIFCIDSEFVMNGGTITDNSVIYSGGGICTMENVFTMNGGTVQGNTSDMTGGGFYGYSMDENVPITINGGSFTDNTAVEEGGGFYIYNGNLGIGGDAVIRDNTVGSGKKNNLLYQGNPTCKLKIVKPFAEGFDVGLSLSRAGGVFTEGYKSIGKADPREVLWFKLDEPDNPDYIVAPSYAGDELTYIRKNSWRIPPESGTFEYGATVIAPSAAARNGNAVFEYSDSETGPFTTTMPTEAGTYWFKASVYATEAFTALEAVVRYEIVPRTLSENMVGNVNGEFVYSGSQYTPTVTVNDGELLDIDDYTFEYGINTDAGEGTVTVVGRNNYTGSVTRTFTIGLAKFRISAVGYTGEYDGAFHDSVLPESGTTVNDQPVTWSYSLSLSNETEYYEKMPQIKDVGYYLIQIKVTAPNHKDNYETVMAIITAANVTVDVADKEYTGTRQTADVTTNDIYEVTVNDGGTDLGQYEVVLTLKDPSNYRWAEGTAVSGENSETATFRYNILRAENAWITEPRDGDIEYGDNVDVLWQPKVGELLITYMTADGEPLHAAPTALGSYKAIFNVESTDKYTGLHAEISFNIVRKKITVTIHNKSTLYGEKPAELTYALEEGALASGDTAEVLNIKLTKATGLDAGTYAITGGYYSANYAVEFIDGTYTINKATYVTTDLTFEGKTVMYNGGTHSLAVSGMPAGVEVTYTNNGKINAGTYEVTATFKGDANYNEIANMKATLTIEKATYETTDLTFAGNTVTYNGQLHSLAVTGLPAGVEVSYTNNGKINAGTYEVTATFKGDANYNDIANMTATLTIKKAVYDMSGVTFGNKTIQADGNAHSVTIGGTLPDGVTVTYVGNGKTEAGEYTVTAKFGGDAENYEAIPDKTAKLTITPAPAPEPEPEPEKGGCGSAVLDGLTIAGITLAVLAIAVVFAMRKAKNRK